MWEAYLSQSTQGLFSSEYPFLHFGQLATVDINTSLPDDVWYNSEEEDTDNKLELFR